MKPLQKIRLELPKPRELAVRDNGGCRHQTITMCLPFYQGGFGKRIHRIRKAEHIYWKSDGRYSHAYFKFWCGGTGFIDDGSHKNSTLLQDTTDGIFCAICEGKATGAGLNGAREICGRTVLFNPRF